jgi:PKD repeat protein
VTADSDLTFSIVDNTNPNCGVTIDSSNRYIDINPVANWYGTSDVTIQVSDDGNLTDTDTFQITVNPVNDAPVAFGNGFGINEDATLIVSAPGVLGNDSDIDGDPLTAALVSGPSSGLLTLNADGSFSYTPDPDFNGTESFDYVANDGTLDSNIATVWMYFYPVNDAPIAQIDSILPALVDEGDTVNLMASFSDPDSGDTHTAEIDWGDGTVEPGIVNESAGEVSGNHVYTDDDIYTVTVTVTDNNGASGGDSLAVIVNDLGPTAALVGDTVLDEGQSGSFDANGSTSSPDAIVLYEWDWDYDGVTFVASGDTGATHSHTWLDDGPYTVAVRVTDDDGSTDIAKLAVIVNNVAPTVNAGPDKTADEGDVVNFSGSFTDPGLADTHTIEWDFGDSTTAVGTLTPSHVYADNGIYTVTLTVTDDDGASTNDTLAVTVNNIAPTVTADCTNQEVQYSDPIQEVSFSATDPSIDTMNAETSYSVDGGDTFLTGLPDVLTIDAGLSFDGAGDQQTPATWTLSGIADLSPGTYIIRVTVTDDDDGEGVADTEIIVNPEDAISTYVGPLFVSTPSINDTIAIVQLRAVIQDITAVDPVSDPDSGNITHATVTFVDRDNSNIIAQNVPVELIDGAPMTGVATFEWMVDLASADSQSFMIGIIVDGYYSRNDSADNTIVTVSKPIENSVTGGGYLVNESPAGIFAGDSGLKTNFGFNVKFNKKLTNLQGHVNIIIRQGDRVYQVKTNAMWSLVADPTTNNATFISKANLIDVTNPDNPISIAGNLTLAVTVTDRGEPGSSDSIGITLWNRNELWFSSNWTGTKTIEQLLMGGNLNIHV